MRDVSVNQIKSVVTSLFIEANHQLEDAERRVIERSVERENSKIGKDILNTIVKNLDAACEIGVPICQDTGMAVVFAEVGQDVHITDGSFENAINTTAA